MQTIYLISENQSFKQKQARPRPDYCSSGPWSQTSSELSAPPRTARCPRRQNCTSGGLMQSTAVVFAMLVTSRARNIDS
jgi:hypothetical protein